MDCGSARGKPEESVLLAALYLRECPRSYDPPWRGWQAALRAFRLAECRLSDAELALKRAGLALESLALAAPGVLSWAERVHCNGQCLTPGCARYPTRWISVLGSSAPPALWRSGEMPEPPYLTIVGSRFVPRRVLAFSRDAGAQAVRLGFAVASGGAEGCDVEAIRGAEREGASRGIQAGVEIVPCGLGRFARRPGSCVLSACPPDAEFTAAAAMERNTLLYALSEFSLVVHARFKEGGAWTGATDALRRKSTRLIAREDPENPAHRALASQGAILLRSPIELGNALCSKLAQPALAFFGQRSVS